MSHTNIYKGELPSNVPWVIQHALVRLYHTLSLLGDGVWSSWSIGVEKVGGLPLKLPAYLIENKIYRLIGIQMLHERIKTLHEFYIYLYTMLPLFCIAIFTCYLASPCYISMACEDLMYACSQHTQWSTYIRLFYAAVYLHKLFVHVLDSGCFVLW